MMALFRGFWRAVAALMEGPWWKHQRQAHLTFSRLFFDLSFDFASLWLSLEVFFLRPLLWLGFSFEKLSYGWFLIVFSVCECTTADSRIGLSDCAGQAKPQSWLVKGTRGKLLQWFFKEFIVVIFLAMIDFFQKHWFDAFGKIWVYIFHVCDTFYE